MTEIVIAKWGNSSAIRLPKAAMRELGLVPGGKVQLTIENGKGVLEPVRKGYREEITLDWIVSEIKRLGAENEPETVEWGSDRGSEIIDDDYTRRR